MHRVTHYHNGEPVTSSVTTGEVGNGTTDSFKTRVEKCTQANACGDSLPLTPTCRHRKDLQRLREDMVTLLAKEKRTLGPKHAEHVASLKALIEATERVLATE